MNIVAKVNRVTELTFTASAQHADSYNDVEMDVVFTGPDGIEQRVPAFWSGESTWRVRFAGPVAGEYAYCTCCSDANDAGLHGQTGTVVVKPYTGSNPLLQHGRLRVAADKRHFEQADGTPFFWIGDTWWMGLCKRLEWPHGFQTLAADRVAKGFNVVQIIAGPLPDMDAWDPRGTNEAGYPFTDGFASINPAYYDLADLKIGHLVRSGLMPCIVGMWGYYLPQLGIEKAKRYWRYIVARYGAYPVAWCLCGEGTMPYYLSETKEEDAAFQRKGWTDVMRYVREIDGYRNLITIHPTRYGREQVDEPELMDFEMLQTGHGDIDSVPTTIESVATAIGREPRMPVINSEVNYEGILGRAWQNIQRLCCYHTIVNGAAGHTYGANGIWQMSTEEVPYGPSPHGRCWGNTSWQEASQLPGSRQIGLAGAFIRQFEWWRLERHPEWIHHTPKANDTYGPVALGIPGELRIVYLPFCWDPPRVLDLEPGTHTAHYFDPCTGQEHDLGEVTPDNDGAWQPPIPPEAHDWVLVIRKGA